MGGKPLTDDEALERLRRASVALGDGDCETPRADTALEAARRAITILILGLEVAIEEGADEVPGVLSQPPAS